MRDHDERGRVDDPDDVDEQSDVHLRRGRRRTPLRAGIIILPSALTMANLFFGIWAIVSAARGEFSRAGWLIVWAGLADMLDGRVARYTQTGSRFGEELDSLVDAISFGVAPALIIFHLFLANAPIGWAASFVYVAAAVMRLARFNIEQAGGAKAHFHGLPSPSAGMTLATFYPFSQTPFFQEYLAYLPWTDIMTGSLVLLGGLMMSHIPYAVVPKFGFHTAKGRITLALMLISLIAAITVPEYYFFPMLMLYVSWAVIKALLLGLFERMPDRDPLLDEEEDEGDEAGAELRELSYDELRPPPSRAFPPRRRGRGRRRGD